MIKFRQKEFIAPVIAAALIGAGGSAAAGGSGIIAGNRANEAQKEMQRKQLIADKKAQEANKKEQEKDRELEEKKMRMAQQQERRLMRLARKNPDAAAAIQPTITVSSGNSGGELKQTTFSLDTILNVANTASTFAGAAGQVVAANKQAKSDILKSENEKQASIAESNARIKESNNSAAVRSQTLKNAADLNKQQYKLANKQINNLNRQARQDQKNVYKLERKRVKQEAKQTQYSAVKEGAGFAKNIGTIAKGRGLHKVLAGAAVAGAVSGTGSYLVDKAIQRDAKKSGILKIEKPEPTEEEKAAKKKKRNRKLILAGGTAAALVGGGIAAKKGVLGKDMQDIASKVTTKAIKNKAKSGARTVKEATKDYFAPVNKETGKRKPDTLNLALTGLSTLAPVAMYAQKKKQLKDQIKQSEAEDNTEEREQEKTYSKKIKLNLDTKKIRKGLDKAAEMGEGQFFRGRSKGTYEGTGPDMALRARTSKLYAPKGRTERYKVKTWWGKFKKKPGETLLDTLSYRTGGGGKKGVRGFGEDLEKLGKNTGNQTSQKVGKFIKEHPKTAMAGSAVIGFGVIRKARNKVSGAASKAIEKVDPNAYAYAKYGAQPIGMGYNNQEEEEENNE